MTAVRIPPLGPVERSRRFAALGDPHRLSIAEELLRGDRSPAWFVHAWGLPSNLIAHHVRTLAEAGLIVRTPSEADRRKVYLQLTDQARYLLHAPPLGVQRVVFVCTHNSARSQFAEALWRRRSRVPVRSGGTDPADRVHPMARRTARGHGVDLSLGAPKRVAAADLEHALVVTVCDRADDSTAQPHLHWSIPDPVAVGTGHAFSASWEAIEERVASLAESAERQP